MDNHHETEESCTRLTLKFTYISFDMYRIFTLIHPYAETNTHSHTVRPVSVCLIMHSFMCTQPNTVHVAL